MVIAYSLYNITLQNILCSQTYQRSSNTAAATQLFLGFIESYPTIVLPMLTGLPGITLVLVGGPILTPLSNPALCGVNLEVVGGLPQQELIAIDSPKSSVGIKSARMSRQDLQLA